MNTVVAYVPVIHAGYLNFFRKNGEGGTLLIPDESITSQIEYLWRDMRALRPEEIIPAIGSLGIFGDNGPQISRSSQRNRLGIRNLA
jgi:hypothetical protein